MCQTFPMCMSLLFTAPSVRDCMSCLPDASHLCENQCLALFALGLRCIEAEGLLAVQLAKVLGACVSAMCV